MSIQGYPKEQISQGRRILTSPLTDDAYKVTLWVEHGDGKFTALEKEPITDRLFVPLKTEHYENYLDGEKDVELRGVNNQFNPETVTPGRPVELRRGYATDDSLWGFVDHFHLFRHIENIADRIDHQRILPGASREEFEKSARDLLGDYGQWIAFGVDFGYEGGEA